MTMSDFTFIAGLAIFLFSFLLWGFKTLPGERWQMMAVVPKAKNESGQWEGINLTFYGVFVALAYVVAAVLYFVLMGSLSVPVQASLFLIVAILLICVPASRIVARVVERKRFTFTVGGASFLGVLSFPFLVWAVNLWEKSHGGVKVPLLPSYAALALSYAVGEGIGRLACISFGCCYGKPLEQCHPIFQRLFMSHGFVFSGRTKKISYETGMEGTPVLPIQAITATLFVFAGLLGGWLFLKDHFLASMIASVGITMGWRSISEFLRADHRGGGRVSPYQVMAEIGLVFALAVSLLAPGSPISHIDIVAGLRSIWNPLLVLFLQVLGLSIFLYTGRSMVTGSVLTFHVHRDRI